MKRILSFILFFGMLLGLIPQNTFAVSGEDEFTMCDESHFFGEWTQVKAPSCDAEGQDMRTCTSCGASEIRDTRITGDPNKILVSAPLPKDYFESKSILLVGDSITYGVGTTKTYGEYLAESIGISVTNKGVSGSGYCSGGAMATNKTLTQANVQTADVITIMLGVNDWAWAVKEGSWNGNPSYYDKSHTYYQLGTFDSTDTSTLYGALHSWCKSIKSLMQLEGFENKQFIVITPLITSWNNSVGQRNWDQDKRNIHGHTFREHCTAIMEVCAYYDIPVFDANMFSGIYYRSAEDNNVDIAGGDGVHVNAAGHALLAEALEEFLLEGYSYENRTVVNGGHNYVNGVCEECRLPQSHQHNYDAVVTPPTCTEKGYTTHTCSCGDSYVDSYADANGHSYENGICTGCSARVSPYLQQLPENILGCTNLYDSLVPQKGYYTATKYDTSNGAVLSVVIPVEPGDRIAASSFGSVSENMGYANGIRVTYLLGDKISSSLSASEVYSKYTDNGYITVPDDVDAVCVPWWTPSGKNWMTLSQISKDFAIHSPKTVSAQTPTCTEKGYTAGEICEVCNASLSGREEIPPTSHTYSDDICTTCGAINIKAILGGEYVSILGDSISTFNGYSNDSTVNSTIGGNGHRYDEGTADTKPGSYCLLDSVNDTWWMHFANRSGLKLLVNNSWAGSQVFGGQTSDGRVIPAAYLERCVNLHDNTLENNPENTAVNPNIIFVYLGINDYNFNRAKVGTDAVDYAGLVNNDGSYVTPTTFGEAYGIMLHKMRNAYPDAQIFAMTLLPENLFSVDKPAWEQHNAYIRAAAEYYNIPLVDLAKNCAITWENYSGYMIDKIHPTTAGMKLISDCIEEELLSYFKENPPHTHSYSASVTPPTCTEKGFTTHTCSCGDSYVDSYVDANGHSYAEWYISTQPKCETEGEQRRDCSACDHFETRTAKALDHDLIPHEAKAPGCTAIGWNAYDTCSRCDYSSYAELPATGHSYSAAATPPTCTEKGFTTHTCSCGDSYVDSYVDANGHSYAGAKDRTCDKCGAIRQLEEEHTPIETTPMYRLYNPNSGEHFYTGSEEERDMLSEAGWTYEGIAWNAPTKTGDPVYRLYNPNSGDHHYTMSDDERDMLADLGWKYEGVAWNSASPDKLPQYRLYNPNADCGSHHYTGSTEERDFLVKAGWHYEGIGWFGLL